MTRTNPGPMPATHPATVQEAMLAVQADRADEFARELVALAARYNGAAQAAGPRYTLHHAGEALEPQAPIEWVVEGLVSTGSVSLVFGDAGTKKTWTTLALAVCASTGQPFLGMRTQRRPVLLIDEESGRRRLNMRLGEVLRGYGAGEDTPIAYTTLEAFNLRDHADVEHVRAAIAETCAGLVVIDALMDIMPGADENAVKDVVPVLIALRKLAEQTQAAIVLIHHANKGGGYRGSSAIKGAVDLALMCESQPDSPVVSFKTDKARDAAPSRFAATCTWTPAGPDGPGTFRMDAAETSEAGEHFSTAERYVLRFLAEHPQATVDRITTLADVCSEDGARTAVYRMVKRGLVARVDGGQGAGRGKQATYSLTEEGRKWAN